MLPEEFLRRIKTQSYINSVSLVKGLEQPSPVSVRVNRHKWNMIPGGSNQVSWCREGFYLHKRPEYVFDPIFHAGCYYPQEASSMFLGEVIRQLVPEAGNLRILDLCGAPGGKSTHLSSLVKNRGFLVANEVIRQRAGVLAENLTKWGLSNFIVTRCDPSAFASLGGFFDIIVVDAPCSGEGMFRDEIAISEWSVNNTQLCSSRQKRIIADVWPALRENGLLIYCTCTFNPGENEENIKWLTDQKKAESLDINTIDFEGITEIDHKGIKGYGFHPGKIIGEGFFISAVRKLEGIPGKVYPKSNRSISLLSPAGMKIISEYAGIDNESLVEVNNQIVAIPCPYYDLATVLQLPDVFKAGTHLGSFKGKDFVPAHDLSLSVLLKKEAFPPLELDYNRALAYLRKDDIRPDVKSPGSWTMAKYRGVSLGLLKNIGNRFNNYYPVDYRIRKQLPADRTPEIINWTAQ